MANADIEKRLDLLEKAQNEYKTKKDMLDDAVKQDPELIEFEDKMKEARKRYQATKEALLNEPAQRKLVEELKDIAQEIKDTKKLLGDELLAYFMQNNTLEYMDSRGITRRIAVSAKFVPAKDAGEAD